MEILEFELSGKTAFFKVPDVNKYEYFTYSSIHKMALLGILGGIIGLEGYNQQNGKYPEFYQKLKGIKCSIEIKDPINITKKFQTFNNSVGYASFENGNNLIIKEQWLEKPSWIIRILIDESDVLRDLKEKLINSKSVYMPYLGKNDHPACISNIRLLKVDKLNDFKKIKKITGMFPKECFSVKSSNNFYYYSERLPYGIKENLLLYNFKDMVQTNGTVTQNEFSIVEDFEIVEIEDCAIFLI